MIVLENVVKQYEMSGQIVTALDNVSLTVPDHFFISIVGKSGSGKSTLLHLMGGLDVANSGDIIIDDINITKLNVGEREKIRKEKIGFVFQFFNLIPELTVKENIIFPTLFSKNKPDKDYCERLISVLGLSKRVNHLPYQLSGGEQQRVAIARSMINKPKYLMMDEPTGNLDSESACIIIEMLDGIYKTGKQSIIIVTHDAEVAAAAQGTVTISDGRII